MRVSWDAFKTRFKHNHPVIFKIVEIAYYWIYFMILVANIGIGIFEIFISNLEPNTDLLVGILLILNVIITIVSLGTD